MSGGIATQEMITVETVTSAVKGRCVKKSSSIRIQT